MDDEVLVGVFGAPHGVRGEIRLKSYMAEPASIAAYGALHDGSGREFSLTACRPLKDDLLVARVKGVTGRDAAQKLTHVKLFIAREKLPPPDEDEFYCRDLIGLRAETGDGVWLGTIVAVPNYGAGDILEVAPSAGETLLFPFTRVVVPQIDLAGGKVIVAPPLEIDAEPGPVGPHKPDR
ncbi:ribosome maturation factor RimM [uncultured Rhodoblastus sp.]|uniref:ribosome maturation factor RimM n=1 Tax=uncultured Rhodoblastus sp. TaxID=543037 RepID=UPI0025FDA120|nr:ribosome maturation factor RimM [uncultured Rhodoblastus sp.]